MTDNAPMDCPILLKFRMVHYVGLVIKAQNDWYTTSGDLKLQCIVIATFLVCSYLILTR